MKQKLQLKEKITQELEETYGKNSVYLIKTEGFDLTTNPKGRNNKLSRSDWADGVVQQLFSNIDRNTIRKEKPRVQSSGEFNFSYIKFAIDDSGKIYGVVSGKSSFHKMYPSDVWFYKFADDSKKELKKYMNDNTLKWYKDEILILKNDEPLDSKEAYRKEKEMKKLFCLFD